MSKLLQLLKGAAKSNTVQFNGAAIVLWLLSQLGEVNFITDNPEYSALLAGAVALVNLLLRFKTSKPLSER